MIPETPRTIPGLLSRLDDISRSSVADYLDHRDDGTVRLDLRKAEAEGKLWLIRRAKVHGIDPADGSIRWFELEMHDKLLALDLMMRVLQLIEAAGRAVPAPADIPEPRVALPKLPAPPRRRRVAFPAVA